MPGPKSQIRYKWYGPALSVALQNAANRGIRAVIARAEKLCQNAVSVSGNTGEGAVSPVAGGGTPRQYSHSAPYSPPHSITGKGRQSIFSEMTGPARGRVGTTSKIMAMLEIGSSGGQTISPVRKKALVFGGQTASGAWGWIFAKQVTRGSIAPRPWLVATIEQNKELLEQTFVQATQGLFTGGGKKLGIKGK